MKQLAKLPVQRVVLVLMGKQCQCFGSKVCINRWVGHNFNEAISVSNATFELSINYR
jgi:hypothetical protein